MTEIWRLIDTGLRPAAQNIALDRALLEARAAEEIPSTLRFQRFTPSALLGCHQSAEQELDLAHCRAHGITVQRRITGGGAIFIDEMQIGWELYLHQRDVGTRDMQAISKRICHAASTAISALGVDARYRPRGEIEVDGRRISDTGGTLEADALLYQGTLHVDFDVGKMLRVLRILAETPSERAIASARERVASLRELLGRQPDAAKARRYLVEAFESEFGVEFSEGDLTLTEDRRYQSALAEIDTADWVNLVARPRADMPILAAAQKFSGGQLRATVTYDAAARVIRNVWFTGNLSVSPRRAVSDLEAALRDLPLDRLEARTLGFFASQPVDLPGLAPADFVTVVRMAVGQSLVDRV